MQTKQKEIILGSFLVLVSILVWWFLKYAFYNNSSEIYHWGIGFWVFVLFGIAFCLAMLLIKNKFILFGSFGLSLILFLVFFNNQLIYYLIVAIILFGAFALAKDKVEKSERSYINLDFWRIWKRGLSVFITAFILLISVIYYFSPALAKIDIEVRIPKSLFNTVVDFVDKFIKTEINDVLRSDLYEYINAQINKASAEYKDSIGYGLAIALFFSLKLISLLVVPVIIGLSWLILKLLITLNFVKLEKVQKEVEQISL